MWCVFYVYLIFYHCVIMDLKSVNTHILILLSKGRGRGIKQE